LWRAARWNCSTADERGSKKDVDGQVKRGHDGFCLSLSIGIPCPKIDFAASAARNRKLRDLLRVDHLPLVSIGENSLNKSIEVRPSDEAVKPYCIFQTEPWVARSD
jgi:hypothetical protein